MLAQFELLEKYVQNGSLYDPGASREDEAPEKDMQDILNEDDISDPPSGFIQTAQEEDDSSEDSLDDDASMKGEEDILITDPDEKKFIMRLLAQNSGSQFQGKLMAF